MGADAPEGCEPHVLVYLAGREEPVEIGQVATHKDEPDYPWVAFSASSAMRLSDPEGTPEESYPDDLFIFAPESAILRIELGYLQKAPGANRRPIGFTVESDPPDA